MKKLPLLLLTIIICLTGATAGARDERFYFPGNMRGVIFGCDALGEFWEATLENLAEDGVNTVIIETAGGEGVVYHTDMLPPGVTDVLLNAVEKAQERGFNVYLTFDINAALYGSESASPDMQTAFNALIHKVHRFTLKYQCDGIILDGYYAARNGDSFRRYMAHGSGMGYENWLGDTVETFFKAVADAVRATDDGVPAGIMLSDLPYAAKAEGFADSLRFVQNGYADFAVVTAPDSLNLSFEEYIDYWGEVCGDAQTPLYVVRHDGENPSILNYFPRF